MVTDTERLRLGKVGMRRAEEVADILVVIGMLVLVPYHKTDGASGGLTLEDTRKALHLVRFLSAGSECRLSRTAAVQLLLDEVHVDGDAGREAVNYTTHTGTVRFTERG